MTIDISDMVLRITAEVVEIIAHYFITAYVTLLPLALFKFFLFYNLEISLLIFADKLLTILNLRMRFDSHLSIKFY